MTKDTTITKVAKMQNLLSYLADDEEEAVCIMIHMCAQRSGADSSKLIKPLDELRAMARDVKRGPRPEWL